MIGRRRAIDLWRANSEPSDGAPGQAAGAASSRTDGRLEEIVDGRAVGWAWCPGEPSRRVTVSILVDGREVATGNAELVRPSLAAAGIGDGAHGFDVSLPASLADGAAHTVSAVAGPDREPLRYAIGFSMSAKDTSDFAGTTFVSDDGSASGVRGRRDPGGEQPVTARGVRQRLVRALGTTTAPLAVVVAFSLCVWLLSGVTPTQIVTFLGYQGLFVIGPGLLGHRLLLPDDGSWLRRLVLGWSLGYVLEIGAWIAVSLAGARGLIWAYPPAVLVLSIVITRQRDNAPRAADRGHGPAWRWATGMLAVCAVGSVAVTGFHDHPLPSRTQGITWTGDTPWDLSIAAIAKHEWPISDPTASGTALPYHTFMHVDIAASSSVTGIRTAVVLYRLSPVLQILLLVLGLSLAGRALTGRPWAGPVCAALFLFVGEANLDPAATLAWGNELTADIFDVSPSFLFGLVLFVPTLILLYESIVGHGGRETRGRWIALTLLFLGCFGGKAATGPVLVGGLFLYVMWRRLADRRWMRTALIALALALAAWGVFYVTVYAAAGSGGLKVDIPGTVRDMAYVRAVLGAAARNHGVIVSAALTIGAPIAMLAAYGAPLVGLAWAGRHPAVPAASLLAAIAVPGIGLYLLLESVSASQVYFFEYSLVCLVILGAEGLCRLAGRVTKSWATRVAAPVAACWLLSLALVTVLTRAAIGDSESRTSVEPRIAVLVLIASAIGFLAWLGWRRRKRSSLLVAVIATLGVGAITFPLHVIANLFIPPFDAPQTGQPDLTAGVYAGLDWIRTHTPVDAVIAVDNRDSRALGPDFNYYYSAFSERRVFVEGRHWANLT